MMLKNPDDRRARRTRKLLKESLLDLMGKKPFSEISVSDVTEGADMNRATFYLHYTNTAQLLQSVEQELLEEIQVQINEHIRETVAGETIRPVLEPVLDFVEEHQERCAMLFTNDQVSQFTGHLLQLIRNNGSEIVRARFCDRNEQQISYLLEFITFGLMGLIRVWFQQNMDLPKEELLAAAELLVDGAACRLLETE